MLSPEQELDAFRFLDRLSTHLKQVQTPQHAVRYVLRETREALGADTDDSAHGWLHPFGEAQV